MKRLAILFVLVPEHHCILYAKSGKGIISTVYRAERRIDGRNIKTYSKVPVVIPEPRKMKFHPTMRWASHRPSADCNILSEGRSQQKSSSSKPRKRSLSTGRGYLCKACTITTAGKDTLLLLRQSWTGGAWTIWID